ncbi:MULTISPECIES: DUF2779 domain-containing protein [unclassified Campylobacter]|uniref:DUF2779 domain-containing protein n=1 Tax=unclassified Campylobacter TaxID=2593542 RepID=UPI0022E9BA87|nr:MULTISPECIES: DUF2779 domain-containing protein [unclassified Campylobacter]MDA3079815.1 DUF2779 domain-containing protein [Campylobacter sp. CS_NA2]MDA3081425.1 DUF2779 domain-containing protein [Campylobacter sp. CS_NA1]MDA3085916.1 DUF2779 domain-containing protein [Campylobacter sp. CS_ED1]MDA3090649.1 DUF2779 domain-containing protein [Campylobacter sp. CS_ED2]WBR50576.1 DUF2779 domain-containing protein [Campylobacter sp. CS_NA3]
MISKTAYINGINCHKSLWLSKFRKDLITDDKNESILQSGIEVGKVARECFKGGVEIEFDALNFGKMIEKTNEFIANNQKIIYEATFSNEFGFAMADILVKNGDSYEIYEVKSSSHIKPYHIDDAKFQYFVINSQIPVSKVCIMHINSDYERNGELSLNELFSFCDITSEVMASQSEVKAKSEEILQMLKAKNEPCVKVGKHCFYPFECKFLNYCLGQMPEISVFNLHRIQKEKACEYFNKGIKSFEDIKNSDIKLNERWQIQLNTTKDSPYINQEILDNFFSNLKYPINFFDFETFTDAVPRFNAQRPFMQIPFQYSLHILHENGKLEHKEFIGDGVSDPRANLIEKMLGDITPNGSIVAYNMSFEKGVIQNLAKFDTKFASRLLALNERFVDLMFPFSNFGYYDSEFKGSFSIKSVLPAMFKNDDELSYKKLEIQNGGMASAIYANFANLTQFDREKQRENLLKYCRLDTLAMVRIFERLLNLKIELSKTNLSKVYKWLNAKQNCIIAISAIKNEMNNLQILKEKSYELERDIKKARFKFVKIIGGYAKQGEFSALENSFLVLFSKNEIEKAMKYFSYLCKKFDIDCFVLFGDENGEYIDKNGEIANKFDKFSFEKLEEFFTNLKNGEKFSFDMAVVEENLDITRRWNSILERIMAEIVCKRLDMAVKQGTTFEEQLHK